MNPIHFKNFDLNLLRVLLALLEHRSVSRAADSLSVTPSAVSHALGRLRSALGDPLFERRGGGLVPTGFALEAGRRLRPLVDRLREALMQGEFDPETSDREFVVAAGSYVATVMLPRVITMLEKIAPHVRLRVRRLEDQSAEDLEHGRLDLIYGVASNAVGRLEWRHVMTDRMVWVAQRNHPTVRNPLTLEMLANVRHVIVEKINRVISTGYPELRRFVDETRELGDATRAATSGRNAAAANVIVPDPMYAVAIAAISDHVTLTLEGIARRYPSQRIQILQPPHPTPPVELGLVYHPDKARDSGVRWLIDVIAGAAEKR